MIELKHISKAFKLYKKPSDRLRELFSGRPRHHLYRALADVSLLVKCGETCGIIGKNGAGKSTLLKVLTGVLIPDSGELITSGKVTGLLELGTGFDPALSGRQNVTVNGLLLGMTHEEISDNYDAIVEFSELMEFIDDPLRTYSSGMAMRLAFAIAIHAAPDCFVIDEALSVGDAHFQQKCMRAIRRFREGGGSIVFVSHDLNAVKMLCDKVLVLDDGAVVAEGSPEEAVNHYNKIIAALDEEDKYSRAHQDYGTRLVEIRSLNFAGERSGGTVISSGEKALITLRVVINEEVADVTGGIVIRDRFGQDIFGMNTHNLGVPVEGGIGQEFDIIFTVEMAVAPGKYTLSAALHSHDSHLDDCYHWFDNIANFEVAGYGGQIFAGVCHLQSSATVELVGLSRQVIKGCAE